MKTKIVFLLAAVLFLTQSNSFAQDQVGGSGGGVLHLRSGYFLLDFAEEGIQAHPAISNSPVSADASRILRNQFKDYPTLQAEIGKKLSEVHSKFPVFADLLLDVIRAYQWSFVDSPLKKIHDAHSHLMFPKAELFQAAVRDGYRIQITRQAFELLDSANQAGLIFHEALYALSTDQKSSDGVRTLNGVLFAHETSEIETSLLLNASSAASIDLKSDDEFFKVVGRRADFMTKSFQIKASFVTTLKTGKQIFWSQRPEFYYEIDLTSAMESAFRHPEWVAPYTGEDPFFMKAVCEAIVFTPDPIDYNVLTLYLNPDVSASGSLESDGYQVSSTRYDEVYSVTIKAKSSEDCMNQYKTQVKALYNSILSRLLRP